VTRVVVAGVTAMDVKVFAVGGTVSIALPLTPFSVAVTLVDPAAIAVPNPDAFTVATVPSMHFQVAVLVTSAVVPSTYVAVAAYCCVFPTGMSALPGVRERAVTVLAPVTMLDVDAPHPAISSGSITNAMKYDREIPPQRRTAFIRPPTIAMQIFIALRAQRCDLQLCRPDTMSFQSRSGSA
jgi:hypothetical protein